MIYLEGEIYIFYSLSRNNASDILFRKQRADLLVRCYYLGNSLNMSFSRHRFLEVVLTPRPRLLKALGVANIAAGLMLPSLPANAEDFTNPYKDPSNFLIGTTEDCLMRENYGRSQNPTTWAYCNNLIFRDTYKSKYDSPLTRLYLINILYRLAGAPEVKDLQKVLPYPDVSVDSNEYFLVIWATREGITKGWGDGKFHPEARVTTSTVTSFLYRAAGSPQKPWYYTWTYDVVPQGKPFWRETGMVHRCSCTLPQGACK